LDRKRGEGLQKENIGWGPNSPTGKDIYTCLRHGPVGEAIRCSPGTQTRRRLERVPKRKNLNFWGEKWGPSRTSREEKKNKGRSCRVWAFHPVRFETHRTRKACGQAVYWGRTPDAKKTDRNGGGEGGQSEKTVAGFKKRDQPNFSTVGAARGPRLSLPGGKKR